MYYTILNLFYYTIDYMKQEFSIYVNKTSWEISREEKDWHEQMTVSEYNEFILNVAYAYRKRLHTIVDSRRELVN
jgi:hypothetical protein